MEVPVRTTMDASLDISISRSHTDMEFRDSRWSTETHTFATSWGEFTLTLEDVLLMFCLTKPADKGATSLALSEGEKEKEKEKVRLLSVPLKISNKSTYSSWARY